MEFKLGLADFTYFMSRRAGLMSDSDLLRKAAKWDLQCVQIGLGKPEDSERRDAIRQEAEDLSLELLGAGGGRPSVECFEREIRSAAALGMTVCRHASGPFRLRQEPVPPAEYVEILQAVAGQAESRNVTIAIENHQDYTAEDLAWIVGEVDSPHVGVCLDTGNSIALLEDPLHTAETLAPFTRMVHLKEYFVMPAEHGIDLVGTPIGTGVVDNAAIMHILAAKAPAETLCITIENPLERCEVPILSQDFVDAFAERPLSDLRAVLSLVAKSKQKHPSPVRLPQEGDASDEEIASAEDGCSRQAVEHCRETLGL